MRVDKVDAQRDSSIRERSHRTKRVKSSRESYSLCAVAFKRFQAPDFILLSSMLSSLVDP